jgi:hypothetical protein
VQTDQPKSPRHSTLPLEAVQDLPNEFGVFIFDGPQCFAIPSGYALIGLNGLLYLVVML